MPMNYADTWKPNGRNGHLPRLIERKGEAATGKVHVGGDERLDFYAYVDFFASHVPFCDFLVIFRISSVRALRNQHDTTVVRKRGVIGRHCEEPGTLWRS